MAFYLSRIKVTPWSQNLDIDEIENYIQETLKLSVKHCLNKVGLQGGHYIPEDYLSKPYSKIENAYMG